jgi:hypothetical protein
LVEPSRCLVYLGRAHTNRDGLIPLEVFGAFAAVRLLFLAAAQENRFIIGKLPKPLNADAQDESEYI